MSMNNDQDELRAAFEQLVRKDITSADVLRDLSRFVISCRLAIQEGLEPGSRQKHYIENLLPHLDACAICKGPGASAETGMTLTGTFVPDGEPALPGAYFITSICKDCVEDRRLRQYENTEQMESRQNSMFGDVNPQVTEIPLDAIRMAQMIVEFHKCMEQASNGKITGYRPLACDAFMYSPDFMTIAVIERDVPGMPYRPWKLPFPYKPDDPVNYVSSDPTLLSTAKALAEGHATMMVPAGGLRDPSKRIAFIGLDEDEDAA